MSKEHFLAKYGSEKHIDDLLSKTKKSSVLYDMTENPNFSSGHIDKFFDRKKDFHQEDFQNIGSYLQHSDKFQSQHLAKLIDTYRPVNGKFKNSDFYRIQRMISHPKATNENIDEIIKNSPSNLLIRHLNDSHENGGEFDPPSDHFMNQCAKHYDIKVRNSVITHDSVPDSALKILMQDKEPEIADYAETKLMKRGKL